MKLNILTFGVTREILGASEKEVDIADGATVSGLKQVLELDFPDLKKLKSYFIAVDDEYADDEQLLSSENEIAIIPPVSGG